MSRTVYALLIAGLLLAGCGGGAPLKADAGPDFSVKMGGSPTFDGCKSTGDIVNYKWTIITPPPTLAADAGKVIREVDAHCSFILDAHMGVDELGEWVVQLEVRDSKDNTATDAVTVTVTP